MIFKNNHSSLITNNNISMTTITAHSGSYLSSDVTLLLDIVDKNEVNNVPVNLKEQLIQTGKQHYSDMLTLEKPPAPAHEKMYYQALQQGGQRVATDIQKLSDTLHKLFKNKISKKHPLVLVSLVRAGLPIGVLLQRALSEASAPCFLNCRHYGVSIIRDRGLDPVALHRIVTMYPQSPIVFVDGWTGKGAIYGELVRSLAPLNHKMHPNFDNFFHQGAGVIPLLTLADPAGVAWLSASSDDWLIPSSLLGSTVSGLISRTLYTQAGEDLLQGLHRSVIYSDLLAHDHSLEFVDTVETHLKQLRLASKTDADRLCLPIHIKPRYTSQPVIDRLKKQYNISNINRIKPTIAEATRAVMRRDPEVVLLSSKNHSDTKLLRHLCNQKQVMVKVVGDIIFPYQAVTIIKKRV